VNIYDKAGKDRGEIYIAHNSVVLNGPVRNHHLFPNLKIPAEYLFGRFG